MHQPGDPQTQPKTGLEWVRDFGLSSNLLIKGFETLVSPEASWAHGTFLRFYLVFQNVFKTIVFYYVLVAFLVGCMQECFLACQLPEVSNPTAPCQPRTLPRAKGSRFWSVWQTLEHRVRDFGLSNDFLRTGFEILVFTTALWTKGSRLSSFHRPFEHRVRDFCLSNSFLNTGFEILVFLQSF